MGYKRGTGCYSKQMLKKDRRLGGHGDHSTRDHKGSEHSKDAKKDDHKEDDYYNYCMKYDKYADKCNADDKCYFYTAKDGDKDKTDEKKPEKVTIQTPGVVVKQVIKENLLDEKNKKKKLDYEHSFIKLSGAGEGSSVAYKLVHVGDRKLRR